MAKDTLTTAQLEELKQAFDLFDEDESETIDRQELAHVIKLFHGEAPSAAELQAMIDQVDIDGDGVISFDEFCEMMAVSMAEGGDERYLKETFRTFDRDDNGYISASELKTIMVATGQGEITDAEVADMIEEADIDGDGQVNFEEFCKMMG